MPRPLILLTTAWLFGSLLGCASKGAASVSPTSAATSDEALHELASIMTGWFDSRAQAAADPDNFLEIRLVMLPIWTTRDDGPWLYVEQASYTALEQPYRQRVYRLSQNQEWGYLSAVYTLPGDPLDFAAAWESCERFDSISPDDLDLREGCSILLRQEAPGRFVGSTVGDGCGSTLADATYATSEVTIEPGLLVSWDRGWDASGTQVWGATEGGYEFLKRGSGAP